MMRNSFTRITNKRQLVSLHNKAVVLNLIYWSKNGISRTQLYEKTDIRPTTISRLTSELLSEGLIRVCGYAQSTGGRRQELLSINRKAGYVIGIDIGAAEIVGLTSDLKAGIIQKIVQPTSSKGKQAILSQVENIVTALSKETSNIIGLGIVTVGLLDTRKGVLRLAANINGWVDVPLKTWAEEKFDLPVFIEGSVKAMALCEKWYGAARNAEDFILVNIGAGVGCSVISGGKIHRGVSETAGEIGHIFIKEDTPLCRCGHRGCLETLISGPAIARTARDSLSKGISSSIFPEGKRPDEVTAKDVAEAAHRGDKLATEIFEKAGQYLGYGLTTLINLINPEMIIIGGGVSKAGRLLLEPVEKTVQQCALQIPRNAVQIRLSSFGDLQGALGATTLVLKELLKIPQLPAM